MTGRQCFSLMSPDYVLILLVWRMPKQRFEELNAAEHDRFGKAEPDRYGKGSVFVAEETGLSLALSETPKTGFLASRPIIIGTCIQQKVQVDMCAHPRSLITLRWAVCGQEMARLIRLF